MLETLKNHWREYLIEAWGLGAFMVSACGFGVLLFHPESPLSRFDAFVVMSSGAAMGATRTDT